MKVAIVRGKFLNRYEMQFFEPLARKYDLVGFGSLFPYHDKLAFPVVKLPSPMDLPDFPFKMPLLNRMFTDAHILFGLEDRLRGFDLVHAAETYYRYTAQAIRARDLGRVRKVIATVLENIPFNNEGIHGRRELKAFVRSKLDRIVALTERTKTALILEGADPAKITVLGHFVDTDRFSPHPAWPGRHAVRKHRYNIFFAGRLEAYKGVYEILNAFKLLLLNENCRQFELTLTFAGNGSELEKMRRFEKRLGINKFIRHVKAAYEQMPERYQDADIYLAPSKETQTWQEQYNTTLLEAQAAGLPIITTSSGGIVENVGGAALLVSPGDVLSLYEGVVDFLLHPRKRLMYAKKARDRALTVHDARLGALRLDRIYQEVLDK